MNQDRFASLSDDDLNKLLKDKNSGKKTKRVELFTC